jgi:hypothetical protein
MRRTMMLVPALVLLLLAVAGAVLQLTGASARRSCRLSYRVRR